MTRRVEFFEDSDIFNLEKHVNEFLNDLSDYKVIDIKYNHSMTCTKPDDGYGSTVEYWYTAMVDWIEDEPVPNAEEAIGVE